MPAIKTKLSERRENTRATTRKWKYWVGHLILHQSGNYPGLRTNGPVIERPEFKPGSAMDVSNRHCFGMLTTDIKQVRWYAEQHRAWGEAVYFEDFQVDRDRQPGCAVYRDGEEIRWLYDPSDADLAQWEFNERDRRAEEWHKHCEARHAESAKLAATIKSRCVESGCSHKLGEGCPRSEHKYGGCVELIKHYRGKGHSPDIKPDD